MVEFPHFFLSKSEERRAERPWELAALIPPLSPHLYLRRLDEAPTIAAGLSRFRKFLSSHYAL